MIYSKQSSHTLEEIEERLRAAAQAHKFGILHVHDLKKTLESKGVQLGAECRIYDVCNPHAASQALRHDLSSSTVLPCRISVFAQGGGCTIATVNPTDLLKATGLKGTEQLAQEVEAAIRAIIDEAAA